MNQECLWILLGQNIRAYDLWNHEKRNLKYTELGNPFAAQIEIEVDERDAGFLLRTIRTNCLDDIIKLRHFSIFASRGWEDGAKELGPTSGYRNRWILYEIELHVGSLPRMRIDQMPASRAIESCMLGDGFNIWGDFGRGFGYDGRGGSEWLGSSSTTIFHTLSNTIILDV